jgi:hypothetical protein
MFFDFLIVIQPTVAKGRRASSKLFGKKLVFWKDGQWKLG